MFKAKVKLFSGETQETSYSERHDAKSHAGQAFNQDFIKSAGVFDENGNTILWLNKNSAGACVARKEA